MKDVEGSRSVAHQMDKANGKPSVKRIILRNAQPPGDIIMLAATVRDLHRK